MCIGRLLSSFFVEECLWAHDLCTETVRNPCAGHWWLEGLAFDFRLLDFRVKFDIHRGLRSLCFVSAISNSKDTMFSSRIMRSSMLIKKNNKKNNKNKAFILSVIQICWSLQPTPPLLIYGLYQDFIDVNKRGLKQTSAARIIWIDKEWCTNNAPCVGSSTAHYHRYRVGPWNMNKISATVSFCLQSKREIDLAHA